MGVSHRARQEPRGAFPSFVDRKCLGSRRNGRKAGSPRRDMAAGRESPSVDTIGVLFLSVHDFPRMLAYYRDVLGLPLSSIRPGDGLTPLNDWARFELKGAAIELFDERRASRTGPLPLPRNNAMIIAFKVGDIRATFNELRGRGIEFSKGIGEADWGRYVHFQDPEGNRLQLYQPRPGF